MFKFIKKLFGSKKQTKRSKSKSKKTEQKKGSKKPESVKKEKQKTDTSDDEKERPALSYVKEMDLTENQKNGIKIYVRYSTKYEFNYQYRLSEFIQDLQSGKIAKKAKGIGKKSVDKILNQMKQDEVL